MHYYFELTDTYYTTATEAEDACYQWAEDNIDELLDEGIEPISIGCLVYSPSEVLKKVDPIAYRCEVADYADVVYCSYVTKIDD